MTPQLLKARIDKELVELSNDINLYLKCNTVPKECYPIDIDARIIITKNRINGIINQFTHEWNVQ